MKYLTFRKFSDPFAAKELTDFLNKHSIAFEMEDVSPVFDVSFANNALEKEIAIKLNPADFDHVESLLIESSENMEHILPEDYYLLDFTDMELLDVLKNPDEWSETDFILSHQILSGRGITVDQETLSDWRHKRMESLSMPEPAPANWFMLFGFTLVFAGGLLGAFIGWYMMTTRKTIPDGRNVFMYDERVRKKGKTICILGLTLFVIELLTYFSVAL